MRIVLSSLAHGIVIVAILLTTSPPASVRSGETGKQDAAPAVDIQPVNIDNAHELLISGKYDEALAAYDQLIGDGISQDLAQIGRADCLFQLGHYQKIIDESITSPAGKSVARLVQLARAYQAVGKYDETISRCRQAIALDKSTPSPRLLLAQTLELIGKIDEAITTYRWFDTLMVEREELPEDAAWLTDVALGFLRYSVLTKTNVISRTRHVLVQMLQQAYSRLDRTYWPARVAAADLLRQKHNNDEADGSVSDYKAALLINDQLPEAYVGLGEVLLEGWRFEEVETHVKLALDINPQHAGALQLLANKQITERRYSDAVETCDKALEINPNNLIALALQASGYACQYNDSQVKKLQARAERINPRPAIFHRILGESLSGIRQYASSEKQLRLAIEIEPTHADTHTTLGLMYMQWGDEDKARDALDKAWSLDPFNKRTKFTLDLLDSITKFNTYESPNFIVRYNEETDPGLGEYVAVYLEEIYELVTEDYDTPLTEKTIIELFPTQRSFAVRITGQPWIHTIGACTGRVIALASPRKSVHLSGTYDLARVLRHEFTHTVTLAATNNRIPHWFTEGLAVYGEDSPRSFSWWELLADATRRDRLFTLESVNWGFIRPKRPSDRQLAYAQSEWMCEYITERFGYGKMIDTLALYKQGQTQVQVFTTHFGIPTETFDADFRVWARHALLEKGFDLTPPEDVEALRELAEKDKENADTLGRLALAEYDAGEFMRALEVARKTIILDANNANASQVIADVTAALINEKPPLSAIKAYEDEMMPALLVLAKHDPNNWTSPKRLGEIALRNEQYEQAEAHFKKLQMLCPMDPVSWRGLAGIYLHQEDNDKALSQLLELARTEENNGDVPAKIAQIHASHDRYGEAVFWYKRALSIDPFNVGIHHALARVYIHMSDTAGALREYTMLTAIDPETVDHWERAAVAAHKLGLKDKAVTFAKRAMKLNPNSSAKSIIP